MRNEKNKKTPKSIANAMKENQMEKKRFKYRTIMTIRIKWNVKCIIMPIPTTKHTNQPSNRAQNHFELNKNENPKIINDDQKL